MPPCALPPSEPAFRRAAARWAVLLPLLGTLVVSCASRTRRQTAARPADSSSALSARLESRVGVVRAVGVEQRFVLIETPSALDASLLSEGQMLHCRPPDALARTATADIRVSRERHDSLVVANVVAGEPAVGAVVFSTPEAKPASLPVPDSISALSTAPLPGLSTPRNP